MSAESLRGKLSGLANELLEAREQVPSAPETGMRPEHQAMLNAMFDQTRETLLGAAEAVHEDLAALAVRDGRPPEDH